MVEQFRTIRAKLNPRRSYLTARKTGMFQCGDNRQYVPLQIVSFLAAKFQQYVTSITVGKCLLSLHIRPRRPGSANATRSVNGLLGPPFKALHGFTSQQQRVGQDDKA